MSRKDRKCPDCVNSGTAPVRKLEGGRRSCPGHAEQRLRHSKRLYARRQEEARAPRGRYVDEPYVPQRLEEKHSKLLYVDEWWMERVSVFQERVRDDARGARDALIRESPGEIRRALRRLLDSQQTLDEILGDASRHVSES